MRMKDSNIGVEFVPLGKPEEVSHYLVRADEDRYYHETELFKIDGKEGQYYEKPNIIKKYLRRGEGLEDLCSAQFVKMYDASNAKDKSAQEDCKSEDEDDGGGSQVENDEKKQNEEKEIQHITEKFGDEAKFHLLITPNGDLGKSRASIIKLDNPLPNEPPSIKNNKS